MKIFIYNAQDNELLEEITGIRNAEIYDEENIKWELGGMGGIQQDFLITDDDTLEFENITEDMKLNALRERKAQTATRAKERALKRGLLTAAERQSIEAEFNSYVNRLKAGTTREDIIVADHIDHTKQGTDPNGRPATT